MKNAAGQTQRCVTLNRKSGYTAQCGRKASLGDRCWQHGGAALTGPCAMTLDAGKPVIWRSDERGTILGDPKRSSKWAAVQFIIRGIVKHGLFLAKGRDRTRMVDKWIRRIESAGVRVILVRSGIVCVVKFEPQYKEESQTNE